MAEGGARAPIAPLRRHHQQAALGAPNGASPQGHPSAAQQHALVEVQTTQQQAQLLAQQQAQLQAQQQAQQLAQQQYNTQQQAQQLAQQQYNTQQHANHQAQQRAHHQAQQRAKQQAQHHAHKQQAQLKAQHQLAQQQHAQHQYAKQQAQQQQLAQQQHIQQQQQQQAHIQAQQQVQQAQIHTQPAQQAQHPAPQVLPPPQPAPLLAPLTASPALRPLVLRRSEGHGFGFTLRHLIVYPPETYSELYSDVRHAMVGAVSEPMDTIFVRSVRTGGAGARAGLRPGDRLLAVAGQHVSGWPYAKVVQLIQQAPTVLTLHIVPKEADVLQRYFSEAAYNPETNQRQQSRTRERRTSGEDMPLVREGGPAPSHPLYTPSSQLHYRPINPNNIKTRPHQQPIPAELQQRLSIDHRKAEQRHNVESDNVQPDVEQRIKNTIGNNGRNDITDRIKNPTVEASNLRMAQVAGPRAHEIRASRRASEGARLPSDSYPYCASPPSSPFNSSRDSSSVYTSGESLQNSYKNQMPFLKSGLPSHIQQANQSQPVNNKILVQYSGNENVPVQYTSRFNFDDRRESNTSLTSSAAESKDSLSSYESISTLTGHETDDSIFLSRMRKSLEQKEEFLRRPSQPTGWANPEEHNIIQQKEFYARPQKLHKPVWPPSAPSDQMPLRSKENVPDDASKPFNNHSDDSGNSNLESANDSSEVCTGATKNDSSTSNSKQKQDKAFISTLSKIHENSTSNDSNGTLTNGSPGSPSLETMLQDKRYPIPSEVQIVSNRTKQFESQPTEDRTAMYKSELSRLSTKKPEPTVALRRKEFESRGGKRDAKSLEAQISLEESDAHDLKLSGNRLMITGSKHLTCPPPEGFDPDTEKVHVRLRSNSTGSEGLPTTRRAHASDGSYVKRRFALSKEQIEELSHSRKENGNETERYEQNTYCDNKQVPNGFKNTSHNDSDKSNKNGVTAMEVVETSQDHKEGLKREGDSRLVGDSRPERPTQLSLAVGGFGFGSSPSSPPSLAPSPSGFSMDDVAVVRRQKNTSHLGAEEERAMRRVSYLKATWGDRLHMDSDHELSDGEHQVLRSAHRRWRPPRFPDDIQPLRRLFEDLTTQTRGEKKDREEFHEVGAIIHEDLETADISIEGSVQIKMVLTNGKRASDRSWKQVWAILQGPKLTLYRHQHQSPTQGGSSESLNLRFSMADVAGDYTKRKHVVRVTSIAGAELLLQAGSAAEAARWLHALRGQAPSGQVAEPQRPLESPAEIAGLSPPSRSKKPANTRTMSPTENSSASLTASPKSKTWKGRVARQLRRMQTGGAPSGASSPSGGIVPWGVGVPLERCQGLADRPLVPHLVGLCTRAVEERGLHVIGVYRVPGNTASVTALKDSLEKGIPPDLQDQRWNDVNVVSSLLKSFFRSLPNPLLTKELYPMFISADKLSDNSVRVRTIRKLVRGLPDHHYETLKFLMEHLKRVVSESSINKMEARNLAIVFGPTLVRSADDNMLTMVNDMSSQCRIIESLINHMEWYFDEEDRSSPITDILCDEELPSTTSNQALLLQNVKKIEGISTKDIVSSIISAANRKIQRKPRSKHSSTLHPECSSPSHKELEGDKPPPSPPEAASLGGPRGEVCPSHPSPHHPVTETDNYPIKTYTGLDQTTQERVKRFEMETRAVLRREKRRDQANDWHGNSRQETSSPVPLSNTHVIAVETESDASGRSSGSYFSKSTKKNDPGTTGKRLKTESSVSGESFSDGIVDMVSSLTSTFDQKLRSLHNYSPLNDQTIPFVDDSHEETQDFGDPSLHRTPELQSSQDMAVHKHDDDDKTESDCTDSSSPRCEESPKLSSFENSLLLNNKEHSEKEMLDKENSVGMKQSFFTKSIESKNKLFSKSIENESESEKDVDITSMQSSPNDLPDNDKSKEKFSFRKSIDEDKGIELSELMKTEALNKNTLQDIFFKKGTFNPEKFDPISVLIKSKLKRSESLNRETEKQITKNNNTIILTENNVSSKNEASDSGIETEKSNSPKLRRSVSLNRSDGRLKRVDSLTKNEKTESNLIKRREIYYGGLNKPSAKLKRKNGMPERSIKRRHTVGGTKDFDKDEWVALGCSRTSSPDLPATLLDTHLHPSQHIVTPLPLESHV